MADTEMMTDRPAGARMRRIRVLFFGKLGDQLGRAHEIDLPDGPCQAATLRHDLAAAHAEWAEALALPTVRLCIDGVMARETAMVHPQEEIAFVPPFSGG